MSLRKKVLKWLFQQYVIRVRNWQLVTNSQLQRRVRTQLLQRFGNPPQLVTHINAVHLDIGFKQLFAAGQSNEYLFLNDFLNGLKIFGNIKSVSGLPQNNIINQKGIQGERRQDLVAFCNRPEGSYEPSFTLGIEMQSTDRVDYFKTIKEYITIMKARRYLNPTILLLARESGQFYKSLELFKNSRDEEKKKEKLQSFGYQKNEQNDFVDNANVRMEKEYYWTYYEQGCPVHCIFFDKLRELFERGQHNQIVFPVNGELQPIDYSTKLFLKLIAINQYSLFKIGNISTISIPTVVFYVLTEKEKAYLRCAQFFQDENNEDRYVKIRDMYQQLTYYRNMELKFERKWANQIYKAYSIFEHYCDMKQSDNYNFDNQRIRKAIQQINPQSRLMEISIAINVLWKMHNKFSTDPDNVGKINFELVYGCIKLSLCQRISIKE